MSEDDKRSFLKKKLYAVRRTRKVMSIASLVFSVLLALITDFCFGILDIEIGVLQALVVAVAFVIFFGLVQAHYRDEEKRVIAEMWKLELAAFKEEKPSRKNSRKTQTKLRR